MASSIASPTAPSRLALTQPKHGTAPLSPSVSSDPAVASEFLSDFDVRLRTLLDSYLDEPILSISAAPLNDPATVEHYAQHCIDPEIARLLQIPSSLKDFQRRCMKQFRDSLGAAWAEVVDDWKAMEAKILTTSSNVETAEMRVEVLLERYKKKLHESTEWKLKLDKITRKYDATTKECEEFKRIAEEMEREKKRMSQQMDERLKEMDENYRKDCERQRMKFEGELMKERQAKNHVQNELDQCQAAKNLIERQNEDLRKEMKELKKTANEMAELLSTSQREQQNETPQQSGNKRKRV